MFALERIQWDTLALNGPATKYQEKSVPSTAPDQVGDGRQLDRRSLPSKLGKCGSWEVWRDLFGERVKTLAPVECLGR